MRRPSVQIGRVAAHGHELGVDERLDHRPDGGPVLAGKDADASLHAVQQGPMPDAGHDDDVDRVLTQQEDRSESAVAVMAPGAHDTHVDDHILAQIDDGEARASAKAP